jgi:tellurite resistance protein TehA-like permease
MKKFINNLRNLPVAVSGLALGIAGISNVLATEIDSNIRYIGTIVALIFLALVAIKKLAHPKVVWDEITHPVAGSFIPAFDMALMIIANTIARHYLLLGQFLWYSAIILHLFFATCFIYHRYKNFDLDHMLPSWFVPPVGIVVACVTSDVMNAPYISHILFYLGFVCYCIMLPIMLYRLIFGVRIQDQQLPAFAIMGAPASLCLVGYLTAFTQPNLMIVSVLLSLALIMTSLVYISMFRINPKRIAFIPLYAAFTFPLAIGATALIKYANFVGITTVNGRFWHTLGQIETLVALVVIIWVMICMAKLIVNILRL